MSSEPRPIACTLATKGAVTQALEWADLQQRATSVEALPAGARMRFPVELESLIADLVRRESACCAFVDIRTVRTDGELVVEVTSANPDALPVISLMSGAPLS